MIRNNVSLVGMVVDQFSDYIAPQKEASFSSSRQGWEASVPTIKSEKTCLLIFLFALAFIAVISPILCFGSLFSLFQLEGMWYFWMITLLDIGCLAWLLRRKKDKNYRKDICCAHQTNLTESTCKLYRLQYTDGVRYIGQ